MNENNKTASGSTNSDKTGFEKGKSYVFNVPPGWILAGTVDDISNHHLHIKDGVYVEGIAEGCSALGSIAMATQPKDLTGSVTRSYPVPDGFMLREDAVLIAVPCKRDMTPLSRANDAAAIKKAAGK